MKKYGRQILAAVLAAILLVLGLDIRYGVLGGPRRCLPVLMYHHFSDEPGPSTMVTGQRFREQMTALKEAGFTAVTLEQIQDYVLDGGSLPGKPVLITIDDGYASNLTIAAPVLDELDLCATVFVISCFEGETIDFRSGNPIWEDRFSYEEALPWVEKGVLDLQSHTHDMHRLAEEGVGTRDGMLREEGESDEAYFQALREDMQQFRQRREGRVPTDLIALSYPFGYWTSELDQWLKNEGIIFTFTTVSCSNRLRAGDPDCMRILGRFNVTDKWTGEKLVKRLERALKGGA